MYPLGHKAYLAVRALKSWLSRSKINLLLVCAAGARRVRTWSEAFFMKLLAERTRAGITTDPKQYQDDVYRNPAAIKLISDLAQVRGVLSLAEVRRESLNGWKAVFLTPGCDVAYADADELNRIADNITGIAERLNVAPPANSVPAYPYVAPHGTFSLLRHKRAIDTYPADGPTHVVALVGDPNIEVRLTKRVWEDLESGMLTAREVVFTWKRASKRMLARALARNSEEKKFAPYFEGPCYLIISVCTEVTEQVDASPVTSTPSGKVELTRPLPTPGLIPTDQPFSVTAEQLASLEPTRSMQQGRILRSAFAQVTGIGDRWIVDDAVAKHPTLYKNMYRELCASAAALRGVSGDFSRSTPAGYARELTYVTDLLDSHAYVAVS